MLKNFFAAVVILISFSGCLKSTGFTCEYDSCQYPAPPSQVNDIQNYLTANNIIAQQHCSGLFYEILQEGTGIAPTACNNVRVAYEGQLVNGSVFDSNPDAQFGLNTVIAGWTNGLPLIKSGGTIRLYIPPYLGYGSTEKPGIPANSILIFEVTLLGVF